MGKERLKLLLATGLGTGYLPIAPGTWGSGAVTLIYVLMALAGASFAAISITMIALAVAFSVACVWSGGYAEQRFGQKDPGRVTADEWAGQALTYFLLPVRTVWAANWPVAVAGFLAFRILDVIKPPPANALQEQPRGWGILLDDLFAGIYANIICQLIFRVVWK